MGFNMRSTLAGFVLVLVLAGSACSSSSDSKTSDSAPPGGGTLGPAGVIVGSGVQFAGDVCTALTKDDIEAATFGQGKATFVSTEAVNDSSTAQAVECHYLASFAGGPSVIVATVSLLDSSGFDNRAEVSIVAPPVAQSGVGAEAYIVQPGPGSIEVWVRGTNGFFKVFAQPQENAVALATSAAARN